MDIVIVSTSPCRRNNGVVDDDFSDDDGDFKMMSSDDIPDVAVESMTTILTMTTSLDSAYHYDVVVSTATSI